METAEGVAGAMATPVVTGLAACFFNRRTRASPGRDRDAEEHDATLGANGARHAGEGKGADDEGADDVGGAGEEDRTGKNRGGKSSSNGKGRLSYHDKESNDPHVKLKHSSMGDLVRDQYTSRGKDYRAMRVHPRRANQLLYWVNSLNLNPVPVTEHNLHSSFCTGLISHFLNHFR